MGHMQSLFKRCRLSGLPVYLLLSIGLHGLLFLIPARETTGSPAWSAAVPGGGAVLVVRFRHSRPLPPPLSADTLSSLPAPEFEHAPGVAAQTEGDSLALPVPASELSLHPVLLNGEVLEDGAVVFPPELSARVVVDVLVNKEGRVERVWQQGELNTFALWLGEQLMTRVRFRPAESGGRRVPTVLRMEFNLMPTSMQAPQVAGDKAAE